MQNRRKFIQSSGAAALLGLMPATASLASPQQIATRLIPGTNESLPVIGLGNSRAFMSDDQEASTHLLNTFLDHGGAYVDVSGKSRFTVGKILADAKAQDRSFLGNYLSGQSLTELRT